MTHVAPCSPPLFPQVECKKAVPKEDQPAQPASGEGSTAEGSTGPAAGGSNASNVRTRKVFVGGLAPAVDDKVLREHFEQFGAVEDAVVMYDHDSKRPRGFGFVTFAAEESVDKVFGRGVMQTILDKQIEVKPAVPRDQMPSTGPQQGQGAGRGMHFWEAQHRGGYSAGAPGRGYGGYMPQQQPYHQGFRGYGPRGAYNVGPGPMGPRGGRGGYGGMGGGGYPPAGRGAAGYYPQGRGGYEQLYGAAGLPNGGAGMFGSNQTQQALYNLAGFQQQLNGIAAQQGAGGAGGKPNFNAINLKALGALASTFGAFPGAAQADPNAFAGDEQAAYAVGAGDADYAAAEAAAAAAAGGLAAAAASDFNSFHDPVPGWSS